MVPESQGSALAGLLVDVCGVLVWFVQRTALPAVIVMTVGLKEKFGNVPVMETSTTLTTAGEVDGEGAAGAAEIISRRTPIDTAAANTTPARTNHPRRAR